MPPEVPEPLMAFDQCASVVGSLLHRLDAARDRYRVLNDAGRVLANSFEALRVEMTYHSNAIEGSTLTLRETQLVLEGRVPATGKSLREVYEARNHDRALRMIESRAEERGAGVALTERDILDVHALVLADIEPASAGRYRSERVLIKGTRFVPPGSHRFGELMPAMLGLVERPGVHPAIIAAELHYNLVAVHPFADGNGRTARLLMNMHMLQHGYPLVIIEVERRGEYLVALEEANEGRCERFAAFVIESAERSIERLIGE
ncbi:MAG: Fic family protein [Phycisphaeraceae bacterium]|nr:Fic family protein [Phycisphaeraceae bacterium]MBX3366398.1 Fic family protein [Phycisphaeraceae bacterium]QYK47721.1 MAG: Fic family protein [Phycisphaeraceae bacterium]